MSIVIKNIKYILTPIPNNFLRILEKYDILVEDNIIKCIDKECSKPRDAIVIDGSDKIVLPAFINIHMHIGSYLLENLVNNETSFKLFSKLYELEKSINREYVKLASYYTCMKLLLKGVIGLLNTYIYAEETIKACSELGLYIASGPLYPISYNLMNTGYDRYIPVTSILPIKYSDYNEIIEDINKAKENKQRILIHLTGTRYEVFMFKKKTGKWPIEFLYHSQLLYNKMVLAHLNWISSMEIEYIARDKPLVSITPLTTMFMGEKSFTPVYEIMAKKIPITIGIEGFSNHDLNPWLEFRIAYLLYKYSYGDNRVKQDQLLYNMLYQPYRYLGIEGGYISRETPGNLIIFRYDNISDPIEFLYKTISSPEYVIINGELKITPNNKMEYIEKIKTLALKLNKLIREMRNE